MKQQSTALFTQLNKQEVENLTMVVKETLATEFAGQTKIFSSVDLWNIQRQRKGFSGRRCFA